MKAQDFPATLATLARRLLPGAILIVPGCTFIGAAVGQMLGDPANWTTIGLGLGAAIWGISLSCSAAANRSE